MLLLVLAVVITFPENPRLLNRTPNFTDGCLTTAFLLAAILISTAAMPRWLVIPRNVSREVIVHLYFAWRAWFAKDDPRAPKSPVGSRSYRLLCFVRAVFFLTLSMAAFTFYAPLVPATLSETSWRDLVVSHPRLDSWYVSDDPRSAQMVREFQAEFLLDENYPTNYGGKVPREYIFDLYVTTESQIDAVNRSPVGWLRSSIPFSRQHPSAAVASWLVSALTMAICTLGLLANGAYWYFVSMRLSNDHCDALMELSFQRRASSRHGQTTKIVTRNATGRS